MTAASMTPDSWRQDNGGPYTDPAAFEALAAAVLQRDAAVDRTSLYLRAESSAFLRFNQAALRQATWVDQAYVTLAVERGQRRAESTVSLGGELALDAQRLVSECGLLRDQLALIADDPWLRCPSVATQSRRQTPGELPDPAHVIARVADLAGGTLKQDFVGFYAAGPIVHAYADSLGSLHWHETRSFHFDWCLYRRGDQAIKTAYAGTHWRDDEFESRLRSAAQQVPMLDRPLRSLQPGTYRTAFSSSAMIELLDTLGWSGFSLKARRTGVSSLMRLQRGEVVLHPSVQLREDFAQGTAPRFTAEGFVRPDQVELIDRGRLPADGGTLNSTRSAAEYGALPNGAQPQESPYALRMGAGTIAPGDLLKVLDRGLYVSNLWYLNYSDRLACRMTGMTRYACFWVEGGKLVAPVEVMRFDDDALRMFGSGLIGLTDSVEFTPKSGTYGARELGSTTAPAAVVDAFRLTL